MTHEQGPPEVVVRTERARTLAAVRRRVRIAEIADVWRPALDTVWAFLRANPGLHVGGHNVFLYHHPTRRDAMMAVDFGVEVVRSFEGNAEVRTAVTPAGKVALAVHVGPYARLRVTHDAVHAWCAQHGRAFAGQSWEIYGDWTDDAEKLETTVVYRLSPSASARQ